MFLGDPKVWNLQPQTLRDYGIRSLADRIKDLGQLMYICKIDDTSATKDEVFSQYYSKPLSGPRMYFFIFELFFGGLVIQNLKYCKYSGT